MSDEKFTRAFAFGSDVLKGEAPPGRREEDSFKQIYGPRMAAVEQRLKAHAAAPPEPTPEELAKEILDAAQVEAEHIRETARREGYAAGEAEGREKLIKAAERLMKVAVEIASVKPRLLREAEGETVALVCEIAVRVLGPLASERPECVVNVVNRAIAAIADREVVTIRVNPADLQFVIDSKPEIMSSVDGLKNLTFIDDHSVEAGGCIIETPSTEIDARLKTQLDEIIRVLGGVK